MSPAMFLSSVSQSSSSTLENEKAAKFCEYMVRNGSNKIDGKTLKLISRVDHSADDEFRASKEPCRSDVRPEMVMYALIHL